MEKEVIGFTFGGVRREITVDPQVAEVLHTCARRATEMNPEDILGELAEISGLFSGFASSSEIKQTLAETMDREEGPCLQVVPFANYPISGWSQGVLTLAEQKASGTPVRAEHLILGIIDHNVSMAAHALGRLGDVNKLAANMQQRLASQAA